MRCVREEGRARARGRVLGEREGKVEGDRDIWEVRIGSPGRKVTVRIYYC